MVILERHGSYSEGGDCVDKRIAIVVINCGSTEEQKWFMVLVVMVVVVKAIVRNISGDVTHGNVRGRNRGAF